MAKVAKDLNPRVQKVLGIWLDDECLYLLSHLISPDPGFYKIRNDKAITKHEILTSAL